jgi:chloride channel protein, CIC family
VRFPDPHDRFRDFARRSRDVVLLAAVTGVVTGFGVALFERVVVDGLLDEVLDLSPWVLAFVPLAGLALAWVALRYGARSDSPATADAYLAAFHDVEHPLRLREVPGRMLAAIATLGAGGAMGMEGPSLYLGASVGTFLQRRFTWMTEGSSTRVLLVAGAAAGVAAIFKAPATGAVFALEVPYQDDLARRMLLPALVASASSYLAFVAVNGTEPLLLVRGSAPFSFADLAGAALLGAVAGIGARGFAWLVRRAKTFQAGTSPLVRILAGGLAMAAIFAIAYLLTDEPVTLGVGYRTIAWALTEEHAIWLLVAVLVLRCLATAATVAGGGVGGLFIPLVVAGALLGRITAQTIGDPKSTLFVIIGVAAFLGAGYRVPLAAVMFVAEASGRPGFVVPALLAAVAASLVMGTASVTTHQRAAMRVAPTTDDPTDHPTDDPTDGNAPPALE